MSARQPYPFSYATHMPVLIGISKLFDTKIKRVLEYGAGDYSTTLFRMRSAFPDLERLVSCETDLEWLSKVAARSLSAMDHTVFDNYDVEPTDNFDLVLIDADTEQNKIRLIERSGLIRKGLTVIHDTDHLPYLDAVYKAFQFVCNFSAYNPCTAVASNYPLNECNTRLLDSVLNRWAGLSPVDVLGWSKIFSDFGGKR